MNEGLHTYNCQQEATAAGKIYLHGKHVAGGPETSLGSKNDPKSHHMKELHS